MHPEPTFEKKKANCYNSLDGKWIPYVNSFESWKATSCISQDKATQPDPTSIKPDQQDPRIKDQLKINLLSIILLLQLQNVSCGGTCPFIISQFSRNTLKRSPSSPTSVRYALYFVSSKVVSPLVIGVLHAIAGLSLGLHSANERWRYFLTMFLIGWAQA